MLSRVEEKSENIWGEKGLKKNAIFTARFVQNVAVKSRKICKFTTRVSGEPTTFRY